jgi:hypothetical protein
MTWRDTLEIGLKETPAYRKDNLAAARKGADCGAYS